MKVTRQNISESYITTSGWVREFTNSLEKNADFLSNVKSVFKKRNAPKTIDEKMADIKARVGYGIVKSDKSHDSTNVKEAKKQDDSCKCCNSCAVDSPCDSQDDNREELIRLMTQLISYIEDFLADRPELSSGAVIEHCRQHPQLSWNILSPKMDHDKLNDFIRSKIKNRSYGDELVKYISRDTTGEEPDDTTPEFMRGPSL